MDNQWTISEGRTKEERRPNGERTEDEPNNLDYDNKVIGARIEVVHQLRKLCYNKYYS